MDLSYNKSETWKEEVKEDTTCSGLTYIGYKYAAELNVGQAFALNKLLRGTNFRFELEEIANSVLPKPKRNIKPQLFSEK